MEKEDGREIHRDPNQQEKIEETESQSKRKYLAEMLLVKVALIQFKLKQKVSQRKRRMPKGQSSLHHRRRLISLKIAVSLQEKKWVRPRKKRRRRKFHSERQKVNL